MRVLLQRVKHAEVLIDEAEKRAISEGLLLLLGITLEDSSTDIEWLVKKITQLRIFNDDAGKMNLSVTDVKGEIMVVSQFTLYADSKKGNRPSYMRSAHPEIAIPLYEEFLLNLKSGFEGNIETGEFGSYMQVSLLNDGPVTILLDSKNPDH